MQLFLLVNKASPLSKGAGPRLSGVDFGPTPREGGQAPEPRPEEWAGPGEEWAGPGEAQPDDPPPGGRPSPSRAGGPLTSTSSQWGGRPWAPAGVTYALQPTRAPKKHSSFSWTLQSSSSRGRSGGGREENASGGGAARRPSCPEPSRLSRVRLCATPRTAAPQAPRPGLLQARGREWLPSIGGTRRGATRAAPRPSGAAAPARTGGGDREPQRTSSQTTTDPIHT